MAISGTCTFVDEYGKEHSDTKITQTLDQGSDKDPVITVEYDGRECSSIVPEKERLDNAEGKKINCYKDVKLEKVEEPKPEEEPQDEEKADLTPETSDEKEIPQTEPAPTDKSSS